jgi:hypothetical protein
METKVSSATREVIIGHGRPTVLLTTLAIAFWRMKKTPTAQMTEELVRGSS